MSLIFFAQTMFGNLIVIRILREFSERALISSRILRAVGIVFALIVASAAHFPGMTSSFLFLLVILSLMATRWGLKLNELRSRNQLADDLTPFLDRWILNLRSGMGHSLARERALQQCESRFQTLLRPLFQGVDSKTHLFLPEMVVCELRHCAQEPHKVQERLQNLRETLRRTEIFRRKSGQALRQANLQATVLLVLQFLLTAFVISRSGWRSYLDLFAVSFALSGAGVISIRYLSRRIRWTI